MTATTSSSTVQIKRSHFAAVIVGVAALGASLSLSARGALDDNRAGAGSHVSRDVAEVTSMSVGARAATYGNVVDHVTAIAWMPPTRQAAVYGNEAVPTETD
jgi:hypothetical protein